ncbi:MAG: DEAD/DEAH box helicase family protein [Chloroflexi bacterium]|nr:DEAD/DEAH box helicase family protein [Chloroflexota bacterium]
MNVQPGALVSYREREWVVLPSDDDNLVLLRPIGGSSREVCGVVKSVSDLMGYSLPYERIASASFPLPKPDAAQDHTAVSLLQQAARLLLRDGAAPFRSLGHLSLRPRPYQYVPLLMALRLETIRLLIADDVGVGKTIEAGLIARELLDRGEIRRTAVLCPPYLCDQWQKELSEKFNIDAVVVRSGTIARLERQAPQDTSIFAHYPHLIASIDTVKSDRYRASFLQHCPEFLIVDEVHGAAAPPGEKRSRSQQQRHELLLDLAEKQSRHLVLLSATPHSGMESSFLSILGLLNPEFRELNLTGLTSDERIDLARHFVQRRRADVRSWMGTDTPFPERDTTGAEQAYTFSRAYRSFYTDVYTFARELVESAETLSGTRQRMRFWSALALMRCVTSSPAAAEVALRRRLERLSDEDTADLLDQSTSDDLDVAFAPLIYDPSDAETAVDAPPSNIFDLQDQDPDWNERDRRRLRDFARTARTLMGSEDAKLTRLTEIVGEMLTNSYQPIVWCRYIATADYVAAELQAALSKKHKGLKVTAVTGTLSDDERRLKVDELATFSQRILVATDCLSEGVNLQEHFNAVIHYDLPWNPNRLEQREGRVDRFGQLSPTIKAVLMFGQDNPVDGAVLDVLLRKARDIYRTLGVRVPIPEESESVMNVVLHSLFKNVRAEDAVQLSLFDQFDDSGKMIRRVHEEWTAAAERERESRTRFAQRAIKPEEVEQELQETDRVLGHPDDVARFLVAASQRLGFGFRQVRSPHARVTVYHLNPGTLPQTVALRLNHVPDPWPITFASPTPEGLSYIGRNHPLVEGLAEYLLDMAFYPVGDSSPAARTGVIRTDQVSTMTTLLLLRLRFLQYERGNDTPTLAEETVIWGFTGWFPALVPLSPEAAQSLLDTAVPTGNVSLNEKQEILTDLLNQWQNLQPHLDLLLFERAEALQAAHRRVRRMVQQGTVRIEPQTPPDLLGVVVLLPVPKGVRS